MDPEPDEDFPDEEEDEDDDEDDEDDEDGVGEPRRFLFLSTKAGIWESIRFTCTVSLS